MRRDSSIEPNRRRSVSVLRTDSLKRTAEASVIEKALAWGTFVFCDKESRERIYDALLDQWSRGESSIEPYILVQKNKTMLKLVDQRLSQAPRSQRVKLKRLSDRLAFPRFLCSGPLTTDSRLQIKASTETQTAVFATARGWTGGMGAPVLNAAESRFSPQLVHIGQDPAYLGPLAAQTIFDRIGVACLQGRECILVKARLRLFPRQRRSDSIPGRPMTSYYELILEELIDLQWQGTPCEQREE